MLFCVTSLYIHMVQTDTLVPRQLFGGAIEVSLPERLVDVSDFRPVPDNQEVWCS